MKRSLWALSDQSGELTEYGISAGSGTCPFTDWNNPVSLNSRGKGGCGLPAGTRSSV